MLKNRVYESIVEVKNFYAKAFDECRSIDEVIDLLNNLIYRGGKLLPHIERVSLLTVLVAGSFRDYGRFGVQFNMPATSECCRMYKYLEDALKKRKPITLAFYGDVVLNDVIYSPDREGDGLLIDQDGNVHQWRIAF